LQGNHLQFHSQGDLVLELFYPFSHGIAHGNRVSALDSRDGQTQCRFAVHAQETLGRVHVATPDIGHIPQIDEPAALAADQQIPEIFFRFEYTRGVEGHVFRTNGHAPGVRRQIFGTESVKNLGAGDAQGRHLGPGHLHVDGLGLFTEKYDLFHVDHGEQFPFEYLGHFFNFGHGETVTGNGEIDAVHIAEIVVDNGRAGPGR